MRLRALVLSLCVVLSSVTAAVPQSVYAVASPYAALQVTTTGGTSMTLAPGEVKTVTITFQNTGTLPWKNDGPGYISLYTYEPKYRISAFDPGTWLSPTQVKRLREASVAPGNKGTFTFDMRAPQIPGIYTETFALASEDTAWISGGTVSFTFIVKAPAASESPGTSLADDTPRATIVAQTATSLKAKAQKPITFTLALKNTGTTAWEHAELVQKSGDAFAHPSWENDVVAHINGIVSPGDVREVQFFLRAPEHNGSYTPVFTLTVSGKPVTDGSFTLPIQITGGTRGTRSAEISTSPQEELPVQLVDEPTMRVGVLLVDEETDWEVKIGSFESDVELRSALDNTLLASIVQGDTLRAAYEDGRYVYGSGAAQKTSAHPLRFVPATPNAVLTITNFDRRKTRGTSYANNTFRNVLELRYNAKKDRTWIINELPMEYYLRGLAETSNSSPIEFQKALLTAARTYAYYHYTHASKHAAEGYHVDAYRDQVYWGYGQEERNPRIAQAVEATRGTIVTYNGQTAITSYFSRSDGRTRNWSDVWGGNIPYAKSVVVPCDQGKTLWGHGVGMSASGAICMANEGSVWKEILQYFYSGVEITRTWR